MGGVLPHVGCGLPVNTGDCGPTINATSETRYFFNASSAQCQMFDFENCGGNGNNFETLQDCQNTCSEWEASHCSTMVECF